MDLSAIFFVLAVLILVGMYLYAPFITRGRRDPSQAEHEISSLMAERDRVINALQELDFDYKLGKVPAEDYPEQRTELLQKGAGILRKLDELEPAAVSRGDAQSRLEQAAASRSADGAQAVTAGISDDDIEFDDRLAPQTAQGKIRRVLPALRPAGPGRRSLLPLLRKVIKLTCWNWMLLRNL